MPELSEQQFERLKTSIGWSINALEVFRKNRIDAIRQYVGYHYSSSGAQKRVPTPFLKLAVSIYSRMLVPGAPRALITTDDPDYQPTAADLELAVNMIPEEINLAETFRKLVIESLFGFGVVKCGLHQVGKLLEHRYGSVFVDVVTLDDLVIDMAAKSLEQIQYVGNDYWLDFDDVMESDQFPLAKSADVKADTYSTTGSKGETRAETVTTSGTPQLFKDKIWLRDVWLPTEDLFVTYGVKSGKLLRVSEWEGPESGPYLFLGFDFVPGNLLPLPPVAVWRDLHELGNSLIRKLGNQADAQKTVMGFPGGNDESAIAFRDAQDGDGIKYSGPKPEELKTSGVDPKTLAFYLQIKQLFAYFGGNIDSLGGLSPMAETLGQDRLISEAANAQLREMSGRIIAFSKNLFRSLVYYEWNDLLKKRMLEKPIPGSELTVRVPWNKKSRKGKLDIYKLDIDPYSLQDNSPGIRLQKLGIIIDKYVLPFMPAIEAAGGSLDVQRLLQLVGKLTDFHELRDLVVFSTPEESPGGKPAGKSPVTKRTYERVNRPGMTERGGDQAMQQVLLGLANTEAGQLEAMSA